MLIYVYGCVCMQAHLHTYNLPGHTPYKYWCLGHDDLHFSHAWVSERVHPGQSLRVHTHMFMYLYRSCTCTPWLLQDVPIHISVLTLQSLVKSCSTHSFIYMQTAPHTQQPLNGSSGFDRYEMLANCACCALLLQRYKQISHILQFPWTLHNHNETLTPLSIGQKCMLPCMEHTLCCLQSLGYRKFRSNRIQAGMLYTVTCVCVCAYVHLCIHGIVNVLHQGLCGCMLPHVLHMCKRQWHICRYVCVYIYTHTKTHKYVHMNSYRLCGLTGLHFRSAVLFP